jgi:hypothetical protein
MLNKFQLLLLMALFINSVSINHLYACATCICGDPTLTLMGTEKPFPNRLRLSTDFSYRGENIGIKGLNYREVEESRLNLGLSYSPNRQLSVAARLPLVRKQLTHVNLAQSETTNLGDVEFSLKYFGYQEREIQPKHMAGLLGGLRIPTASEQEEQGQPLDIDVQPGAGNWLINGGAWYGHYRFPWFLYASSVVRYALDEGFQNFSEGTAVVTTLQAQYAYNYQLAFFVGLDTRWSEKHQYDGQSDPDSGGFIGFLTPGLVVNLAEDLLFNVSIQWPAIENLHGNHEEEATFQIGVVYDF